MSRTNNSTTIDTSIALDTMSGAKEIVRNQAARQDDAITWWGGEWGARNDVVVAINGGFYNTTTGVIDGGQVQSGSYAHFFADTFSGFAWRTNQTPFIGECVSHSATKVYVKFPASANTQAIDGINRAPGNSDLVIFTSQYNSQTPSGTRTEVLVEMSKPNLTTSGSGYSSGTIRSVAQNTGSTWIPFDHVVLSAGGSAGTTLNGNASVGAEVRIFQELTEKSEPDEQGNGTCQTATGVNWANVFAAINVNYHFLKNSVVRVPDAVAHPGYIGYVNLNPRTAICYNADYVFFVVVDGRSAQSAGIGCADLGYWARSVLGATDGVNLDGGGSSTMVVNGVVKNVPSDGSERAVCNGVLMINPQPKVQSTAFTTGLPVITTGSANVRLGPGTDYYNFSSVTTGARGTIVGHALNGVQAKGYYWWKCNFSGTIGWVAESLLNAARPLGIDVSVWQGSSINWTNVKNSGVTFAWVKATQGIDIADSTFAVNIVNAKAAGVLVGAYHFAEPDEDFGTAGAAAEATYFWNVVKNYVKGGGSYLMPVLDMERATNTYTKATMSQWVNRWCQDVVNYAAASNVTVRPVIYTGISYASSWLDSTVIQWPLWMSNPSSADPQTGAPAGTSPWSTWKVWQYSWTGSVPGVPGACDMDVYNGPYTSLVTNLVIGGAVGNPPGITKQPVNRKVVPGGTAWFMVAATGDAPLSYQWQRNQTTLANGGHYSGCATATLTVSHCDDNDAASYRCVVTNAYGSVSSSDATLTLVANPPDTTLTVIPIPAWLPGTTGNEGRAISLDAKYVVGVSGTGSQGGYLYDLANGLVIQPNGGGSLPSLVTGVAYRSAGGVTQLILDGMSAGVQANWMTTNGCLTWGAERLDPAFTAASVLPVANSLGASTGSDVFYQLIRNSTRLNLWTNKGSNTWDNVTSPTLTSFNKGIPSPDTGSMNGVAATGRAVGYRQTGGVTNNYVLDYPPSSGTAWNFNGLNGTIAGEGYSISADGSVIFGQSPVSGGRPGRWGYKAVVTTTYPGVLQSISELPKFVDTIGNDGSAGVPYGCTADGKYTVGMSYRGLEKAVLWNTSDANPANWTVTDLTDLAASKGILGNFTRLTRGYSVGTNAAGNPVITGIGNYNDGAGAFTRGFLMVVVPATLPPSITQQPVAQFVCPGGTATFTVTATGSGTLTYQWQKNQINLAGGGHYSGVTTTTLTVSNADGGDLANYRCVVSNSGGNTNSGEAALVLKAVTTITQHPSSQTIWPGSNVTFTVAGTGEGTLAYQWRKNGNNLSNGGHYTGATTAALTVSGIDANDVAGYLCVVTGGCGSVSSSNVTLRLQTGTIYGTIQLQGFTGVGPRAVQWVASDSGGEALQTNDVSLSFSGSPKMADYVLNVPTNTAWLSAKTGWNLRRRQAVMFSVGLATNNFTGMGGQLLGGDVGGNDNLVNTADYTVLKGNWLKSTVSADLTGDGLVNTTDYTIMKGNWLKAGDPP